MEDTSLSKTLDRLCRDTDLVSWTVTRFHGCDVPTTWTARAVRMPFGAPVRDIEYVVTDRVTRREALVALLHQIAPDTVIKGHPR